MTDFKIILFSSETVNHLLEDNQKYLSQLTSLVQETTEEKSESVMVSLKSLVCFAI